MLSARIGESSEGRRPRSLGLKTILNYAVDVEYRHACYNRSLSNIINHIAFRKFIEQVSILFERRGRSFSVRFSFFCPFSRRFPSFCVPSLIAAIFSSTFPLISLLSIHSLSHYRLLVPLMDATKPPNALVTGSRDRDRS